MKRYRFHQLSARARERACQWQRDSLPDDWSEATLDYWKEQLAEKGFTDAEIQFSGFWSQGDGASFTADVEQPFRLPRNLKRELAQARRAARRRRIADNVMRRFEGEPPDHSELRFEVELSARIKRHRDHYVHEYTIYAEVTLECGRDIPEALAGKIDVWARAVEEDLQEQARTLSREIYRALEAEYDYQTSEKYLAELAKDNDWWFDVDGDLLDTPRLAQAA